MNTPSIFLRVVCWTGALFLVAAAGAAADAPEARFERAAKRIVSAVNAQDVAAFRANFNQTMAASLPPDRAQAFIVGMVSQLGTIRSLGRPSLKSGTECVLPVEFERGGLTLRIYLDADDRIAGLAFEPPEPGTPVRERNAAVLRLPGRGEWFVFWGGETPELNAHSQTPNQRYAFDLVATDASGQTHRGSGQANGDYYAFGREVLAPAAGEVTDVISGVRDNRPGSMNPYSALGNAVFIRHSQDEVSVLAHLQLGSIRVAVGDRVAAGDVIALCGNSGNSSEPHLHYHLQQTPTIQDGQGIRCFFTAVRVSRDGASHLRKDYSPVKGDRVENAP